MRNRRILLFLPVLALSTLFCLPGGIGLPGGIQQTLEALTQQVPAMETQVAQQLTEAAPLLTEVAQTIVPGEAGGSIAGGLGYPAESIPPMRVFAFQVGTDQHFFVDTVQGQNTYQIDNLPPGVYHVIAYTIGGNGFPEGFAGAYSQAVPCGLGVNCMDHTLIDVNVSSGQVTGEINPGDWYAPPGTFPPMPSP